MTQQVIQLPYTSQQLIAMLSDLNGIRQKLDGNIVSKSLTLEEGTNVEIKDTVYSLASYLPNDNSDYMIFGFIAAENASIEIFGEKFGYCHLWCNSSSYNPDATQFAIIQSSKSLTVKYHAGKNVRLYLSGYMKIGTGFNS